MKTLDKVVFDCEVSERKVLIVPTSTITFTEYNPVERVEVKKLKALAQSIKDDGLIYPLMITEDRTLIDGNRRLTALKMLGFEKVECIISDIDKDKAFSIVNTLGMKITNRGWLQIGLGGGFLESAKQKQYDELHDLVGKAGIKNLIECKLGLTTLNFCKKVKSYGVKIPLEAIILRVASFKLTNVLNIIIRDKELSQEERLDRLEKALNTF